MLVRPIAGAGIAALYVLVHLIMGGRDVASPLRRGGFLDRQAEATASMCWYFVSATLVIIAGLAVWGGATGRPDPLIAATILSGAFAVVGRAAARILGVSCKVLPQEACSFR